MTRKRVSEGLDICVFLFDFVTVSLVCVHFGFDPDLQSASDNWVSVICLMNRICSFSYNQFIYFCFTVSIC